MIDTSLFPYESFPIRLDQKDENRICWFKDEVDLQKHLDRYKLDKRKITVSYRDGKPVEPGKTNKKKVRQAPGKSSDGSGSGTRRRTKSVDAPRNTTRTRKPKK